jgi:soluble lytic murein transglycosylase
MIVATVVAASVLLVARRRSADDLPAPRQGDVAGLAERTDAGSMPEQARRFLATDRPWRAALVMRRYLELEPDAPADQRVLAARAEAGWNAWPEALALLEGVPALETHEHGVGLWLLGRARDAEGDASGAAEAYGAFLALSPPAGELEREREAARLRQGLALLRAGEAAAAEAPLRLIAQRTGAAATWVELLQADALAERGDSAAVRRRVASFDEGMLGLRAWRARIQAAKRAGDVSAARALAARAHAWARTDATRAELLVIAGELAVEAGDAVAGRRAWVDAIDLAPGGAHARNAAELLRTGTLTARERLALSRALRAQGLHEESLDGFRAWLADSDGSADERAAVQQEYATALFYAERYDEVREALRPIADSPTARMLEARAEERRGDAAAAVRVYLELAEELGASPAGIEALYLAAAAHHDDGNRRDARELYERVVSRHPRSTRMPYALMRLAGMAFMDEEWTRAATLWERYRTTFPRGPLALEATYWAGRAHAAAGDSDAAARSYRAVLESERDSYYALLASQELGEPFWPIPMPAGPREEAAAAGRVSGWMRGLDVLRAAGFAEEAAAQADRVVDLAGRDEATLFALGEALAERGYSRHAIRIGVHLRGNGELDERLIRLLYPFPYRTLITEEARDRGLDPYVAAALMRQESLFDARVTSLAGARGLMQIMPTTGAELADSIGIEGWNPEWLYHPEINVHLGTAYLAQLMDRYDKSLAAVFAAYNAGPDRVDDWRSFPEFGRDDLFAERIPFRETRDYVKILTRNRGLYQGIYGDTP